MADFYNLADQKLFKDYQFLPQEKYRLGLNLPTDATEDEVVTNQGIVNTNAFANAGGGGDGFSVYNPDPNTIVNRDYNDRPYQTALYNNSFSMMGDPEANIATGALNADGSMSYAGDDDDEELTGIRSLISKGVNLIPGMGMLTTAAQAIGSLLPINERAIMENELGGQGIMVNDIGQIVQGQGNYNTAQNIMAGYNANMIDADTLQNRRDTIYDALKNLDKYDDDSDEFDPGKYQQMIDKLSAIDEFAKIQGIAIDRKDIILDYRKKQKEKEKKKKDTTTTTGNDQDGDTTDNNTTDNTGTVSTTSPDYTPVGPNQPDPGPSINQQIDNNNPNNNNNNNNNDGGNWGNAPGTPGGWGPGAKKDGGRVGLRYGGIASL
jgi:hypothetical protein